MISKPPGEWANADPPAARAVRTGGAAIAAGVSGVARGLLLVRAVFVGLTALILGWAALAAGVIGRDLGTMAGAGALSLLAGWWAIRMGRRALGAVNQDTVPVEAVCSNTAPAETGLATARAFGRKVTGTAPVGGGGSIGVAAGGFGRAGVAEGAGGVYSYRQGKLMLHALRMSAGLAVMVVLAVVCRHSHKTGLFVFFAAMVLLCGWYVSCVWNKIFSGDLTALSWDGRRVSIRALYGTYDVPWQDLMGCEGRRQTLRVWGIIPVSSSRHLVFRLARTGWRRRVHVLLDLTDMPDEAVRLLALRIAGRGGAG